MTNNIQTPIAGKLPIWQFVFAYRPREEEQRFRRHYLDSDIRQILAITLTVMAVLTAVTISDIPQFSEVTGLSLGAGLRIVMLLVAGLVYLAIKHWHSPAAVDAGLIGSTLMIAVCMIGFYAYADVSAARVGTVITLAIVAMNISYPVYSVYLLPAVLILLVGGTTILFNSPEPEFAQDRAVIVITFIFAELFGFVTSAYWQHNRYLAFRALSEVKTLSGMIPICSNCKKIRDDSGFYQQLEKYISEHSNAQFSHGVCPECIKVLYGNIEQLRSSGDPPKDKK